MLVVTIENLHIPEGDNTLPDLAPSVEFAHKFLVPGHSMVISHSEPKFVVTIEKLKEIDKTQTTYEL